MSFTRSVLMTNETVAAPMVTGAIDASGADRGALFVNVTSKSGTTPVLAVFLQGSPDDGTTWFDLPADLVCPSVSDATAHTTTASSQRNALLLSDAVGAFVAIYKFLPFKHLRGRLVTSGTSPEFVVSITLDLK